MKPLLWIGCSIASFILAGCGQNESSKMANTINSQQFTKLKALSTKAPVAPKIEHVFSHHGISVSDPYHWLKDQGYPVIDDKPVLDYLNSENDYYQAFLEPNTPLVDELFEEFKGRVDETETSVPYVKNGYEYWWEYKTGNDYPTYFRKSLNADGKESEVEVYFDEQVQSKGHDYFVVGDLTISPDNRLLAYSVDTDGDERYNIFVRDIKTGKNLDIVINDSSGSVEFAGDSNTLVYEKLAEGVWRGENINVIKIDGSQPEKTIFTESDTGFFLSMSLTSSKEWLVIDTGNRDVSELVAFSVLDLMAPGKVLLSRERGIKASVDHANGQFYLLTNDKHVNFRLAKVADSASVEVVWTSIIEGSDSVYLRDFQAFNDQLVVQLRRNGLDAIHVIPYQGAPYDIEFPESVYSAGISTNPSFEQDYVRLSYQSMVTPSTTFDFKFLSKSLEIKKQKKIPSGYDKSQYITKRLMAPGRDGAQIPISIVYKKGFNKDGSQPLSLYAYGAYGMGMSPSFSTTRLSLLDRGFSFAIAHTRGGDEMGYNWYLDGKMDNRQNAFNDFIDVAQYLVNENYVAAGNISISGGSAGGKMVGAAVVQAPEMWRSATLMVPFVDVLNTILDESLPLTPPEWLEWGNPITSKKYFELIQSYSPYDNIEAREYPPMMVTGGLNDPRVTYWEPAKWVAKMRATKKDNNLLVMRMNMGAGHFANSGRFGRLRDRAEEMAFQILAHSSK